VEQNLKSVVFLILNQVETHVELSEQTKIFHISELSDFWYFVKAKIQKSETIYVFKASKLNYLILAKVKSPKIRQLRQSCYFR